MSLPERISIAHEAGYWTDKIGRYDGGQFFASAWNHLAYVHHFDADGSYRESTIVHVQDRALLDRTLDELVASLPGRIYGDIAVRLFQFESDGVLFGLVDTSGDRVGDGSHLDWAELYPDGLGFSEPWDGLYST